ncbi:MAG: N-acetylmuramoyl-L-alanine amidase, partial [Acidimicrobiales bacterium]
MTRLLPRLLAVLALAAAAVIVPVEMAWGTPETRMALLEEPDGSSGQSVPFPATHLGLRWSGDDNAVVEVRWERGGVWQAWQPVAVAHDLQDTARGLVYSGILLADGATRVQTRVRSGEAADVEVAALDTEHGRRRLVRATLSPAGAQAAPTAGRPGGPRVAQPQVVSRAEWGADETWRGVEPPTFAPVTKLFVHHTATPNVDPDPAATMRAVYAFHTKVRGFNDIGYNWLVDASGRIYEGRYSRPYAEGERPTGEDAAGRGVVGAHAEGANTGSVGIALLGDFTTIAPSTAAVSSLQAMLAWAADRHGIDPLVSSPYVRVGESSPVTFPNIAGHRDARATECPGDILYARLPSLRQLVADTISLSRLVTPGYWVASRDGRVEPFGTAGPLGDLGGVPLNSPVQALATTPSGAGYWLLTGDGGIFSFGDAAFYGSTGAVKLNQPIVGMAPTPSGKGYWLVARDGGIFAFGDAVFRGSTGAIKLNQPVVGMAPAPLGEGYWLVARDGGLFAFNAPFLGSIPGLALASFDGSAAMRSTPTGRGYYILGVGGGGFSFGDALFHGARAGLSGPTVAVVLGLQSPRP